jgi:uncharacterized membrane protein YagU involved in acid resistance
MRTWQRGACAGFLATGPMTYAMIELFKRLSARDRHPLPPSTLTEEFESGIGIESSLSKNQHLALTMLAHFGYGAACGAVYGSTFGRNPRAPVVKGIGFGLGVWALSYLGLIPALKLKPAAKNMSNPRNALMIAAHVVWGASLGLANSRMSSAGRKTADDLLEA